MSKFSHPKRNLHLDEAMDPEEFAAAADADMGLTDNDLPADQVDALIATIDDAAAARAARQAEPPPAQAAPMMTMDQVIALLQGVKGGFSSEDLKTVLSEVMSAAAHSNASAMQTALNRENPNYVTHSPFHEGGKEATPVYDVYFGPAHSPGKGGMLPRDMFTPIERDLVNRFTPGQMKTTRNGDWSAEVVANGSTRELIIKVPMTTIDQRGSLPSFAMILRELLDGELATSPEALIARVAELERKLAATAA